MYEIWHRLPDDIDQFVCYVPDKDYAKEEVKRLNSETHFVHFYYPEDS